MTEALSISGRRRCFLEWKAKSQLHAHANRTTRVHSISCNLLKRCFDCWQVHVSSLQSQALLSGKTYSKANVPGAVNFAKRSVQLLPESIVLQTTCSREAEKFADHKFRAVAGGAAVRLDYEPHIPHRYLRVDRGAAFATPSTALHRLAPTPRASDSLSNRGGTDSATKVHWRRYKHIVQDNADRRARQDARRIKSERWFCAALSRQQRRRERIRNLNALHTSQRCTK